ncbi:MAG: hypothetical protein JXR30_03440 [Alphaproteobacteria bacterium]|nr:hypothetical protein [Alphaproteobacteria bacterium]
MLSSNVLKKLRINERISRLISNKKNRVIFVMIREDGEVIEIVGNSEELKKQAKKRVSIPAGKLVKENGKTVTLWGSVYYF